MITICKHSMLVSCLELQSTWPRRDLKRLKTNFYIWDSEQVAEREHIYVYKTNNIIDPKNSLDIGGQQCVHACVILI